MMSDAGPDRQRTGLPALAYLGVLFFAAVSVLVTEYRVYGGNHVLQIPLVHMLHEPSLFPNDPFAATLKNYASSFWRVVAFASLRFDLTTLLLALFCIERVLLVLSAAQLANRLGARSAAAIYGGMAVMAMAPIPLVGGAQVVKDYVDHTGFSVAFFLFAMGALQRGRPKAWAVFYGLGCNCNIMYGAYAATYYLASWVSSQRLRSQWRSWAWSLVLSLLVAAPAIYMALSSVAQAPPDEDLWVHLARLRLPHHLFPSTWEVGDFAKLGLLVALWAAIVWRYHGTAPAAERQIIVWTLVALGWLAHAFLAAHAGWSSLLIMHPGRGLDLWCIMGSCAAVSVCARASRPAGLTGISAAAGLLAVVAFWWRPLGYWFLALWVLAAILPGGWLATRVRRVRWLAVGVALLPCLAAAYHMHRRWCRRGSLSTALLRPLRETDVQTANWIRDNTPRDALILVNARVPGLVRTLGLRPVFTTWKDGSALLWERSFAQEWTERLAAIGIDARNETPATIGRTVRRAQSRLTDEQVSRLGQTYGVSHWVVRPSRESRFATCYENATYKILRVVPLDPAE